MKMILLLLAATSIMTASNAQSSGRAEQFRQLYEKGTPGWNHKISFTLTTNKIKMKKSIIMATLISTAIAVKGQTGASDEQAIRNIVATMQKAWNVKDGKLWASGFAKVHDYIVINGMYLSAITPEINANAHQGIFNSIYKTTDLELRVDKVTFVRPDLALVYVIGATYQHGTAVPENPGGMISMVVEKKNDEWKIISFHNCDIEISFDGAGANQSPIPPKVMYASWYKK